MLERKNKRIQPRRLLSFGLVVLLFSLISTADIPLFQRLSAQPFTPLPEPKFPPPAKKVAWEDSFRKAETLRMNSPSNSYSNYLRILPVVYLHSNKVIDITFSIPTIYDNL